MRSFFCIVILISLNACQTHHVNFDAMPVYPVVETEPVASNEDAADDPAIWVNPANPENSLVLGTNKKLGLAVYNLAGKEVQFLARGRLNNVDLRSNVRFNDGLKTLAVATNRTATALDIFSISSQGQVAHIFTQPVSLSDPYGICLSLGQDGSAYAFANSSDGEYQQWLLNPNGELAPELLGSFQLDSQPEGCAVDDVTSTLYLGEEEYGIWMMPADATKANERTLIARVGQGQITADVEGMDIYRATQGRVYLIASSQGDNSYAIYDLANEQTYIGSIRIDDNRANGIDGSQETDGLAVTSVALGESFPRGMLVVQDGFNESPAENQNFKLISWQDIEEVFSLPVE